MLAPRGSEGEKTTLDITIENSKLRFPVFTYQLLNMLKYISLILAAFVAIINH